MLDDTLHLFVLLQVSAVSDKIHFTAALGSPCNIFSCLWIDYLLVVESEGDFSFFKLEVKREHRVSFFLDEGC